VSSFLADIFTNNALNNGLLIVQVPDGFLKQLFNTLKQNPKILVRIDLENQEISLPETGLNANFPINSFKKKCLLNGFDDIDYLLSIKQKIVDFEKRI
jgi:3-isopropylmalate/(R)-2-methylmalate dehydratase small subunit